MQDAASIMINIQSTRYFEPVSALELTPCVGTCFRLGVLQKDITRIENYDRRNKHGT